MSIEETEIVAAIGVEIGTGNVIFTITDHLESARLHVLAHQPQTRQPVGS